MAQMQSCECTSAKNKSSWRRLLSHNHLPFLKHLSVAVTSRLRGKHYPGVIFPTRYMHLSTCGFSSPTRSAASFPCFTWFIEPIDIGDCFLPRLLLLRLEKPSSYMLSMHYLPRLFSSSLCIHTMHLQLKKTHNLILFWKERTPQPICSVLYLQIMHIAAADSHGLHRHLHLVVTYQLNKEAETEWVNFIIQYTK